MIEESTSEDIYHVPELQELTQDRETIAEQHNDTKLSQDDEPEFALEVSVDKEEEYQPTYYFKHKAIDHEE